MTNRKIFIAGILLLVVLALLVMALLPSPVPVTAVNAKQEYFAEYAEDEGRTRLRDVYVVSTPISGYLRRVQLEAGDAVEAGDLLFQLEALPAPALDARAREQARESVAAARARLESMQSQRETVAAQLELAESEFRRAESLREQQLISANDFERILSQRNAVRAAVRTADHSVDVARFELESARAVMEIADGKRSRTDQPSLDVRAPIAGTITERHRCCEGTVNAGEPIMEIGNLNDLEVQVDLLSMDAVRVREGMRVILERWGGDAALEGRVRRVEPAGFMRVSALGVDEQRVPTLVEIVSPREAWESLGVGFRVEARFVLWEADDVVQVPTSALFRSGDKWAVFVIDNDRAVLREVAPGRRSGLRTAISNGVEAGEAVITHPGDRVQDGTRVEPEYRAEW